MDVFLSQPEKSQVQRMYQKWLETVNPDAICGSLFSQGILSDREKQEYDTQATKYGRADFLFSSCLIRATYPQIQEIRSILIESEQEPLAMMLPIRRGDPYGRQGRPAPGFGPAANHDSATYRPPPYQPPPRQQRPEYQPPPHQYRPQYQPSPQQPGPTFRQQAQRQPAPGPRDPTPTYNPRAQNPPAHQGPGTRPVQETVAPNIRPTAPGVSETRARQPAPTSSNTRPVQGPTSSQQVRPSPPQPSSFGQQPNQQQGRGHNPVQQPPNHRVNQENGPNARPASRLPLYPTRDNSNIGKGYCLIVANFTKKYKGYEDDIEQIENFFGNRLRYKVKKYRNLPVRDMKMLLDKTVEELGGEQPYDRFFLFILSEGNDEEICGSRPSGDVPDLDPHSENRSLLKMEMEDIVKMFTHEENRLPQLRSLPKVFFFQNCMNVPAPGSDEMSRPAGGPQSQPYEGLAQSAANTNNDKVTVGADIFVCKAKQPGYLVANNPSWMIQHLIDIFKQHYKHEHFVDMVTQLNFELARRVGPNDEQENHLLKVSHNLTAKFYLFNP